MAIKTNHIQEWEAYCLLVDNIVRVPGPHARTCLRCPYYNGSNQGDGVECLWNEGTDDALNYSHPRALMTAGRIAIENGLELGPMHPAAKQKSQVVQELTKQLKKSLVRRGNAERTTSRMAAGD